MTDILITVGIVWALGAVGVAIGSLVGYAESVGDGKRYRNLYSASDTEARKRKHSRRFFTAYAWPVWSSKWIARQFAAMHATAFGPQDKDGAS